MNFLKVFLLINNKLTIHDDLYQQVLLLIKTVNFVMHPQVKLSELDQFDQDVQDYVDLNKKTNQNYIYKIHHLEHYSMLIKHFGPLINYSCLRFERVHQTGKNSIHSSRNKQNLPFSIAKAYIYNLASHSKLPDVEILITKEHISNELEEDFLPFINLGEDLVLLDSTVVNKIKLNTGSYYLYKTTDLSIYQYPIFFYVEYIVKQSDGVKVLGNLVHTKNFIKKHYGYLIDQTNVCARLNLEDIPYYKEVNFVTYANQDYILKDFHIFYDQINYFV